MKIVGNYAELSSNVISMIYSRAIIKDSLLSNERNRLHYSQLDLNNVEAGVANMNYQSDLEVSNATVRGYSAQ